MGFVQSAAVEAIHGFIRIAWVFPLLIVLELAFPRERYSWLSRLRGLSFWSVNIVVAALVVSAFGMVRDGLHIRPLLDLRPSGWFPTWLAVILAPLIVAVVNDFFVYWTHRAEHRHLWRFHSVHHSIREMSAVNSYDHISEELIQTVFKAAPLAFLLGLHSDAIWIVSALLSAHGFYLHSTTKLHFGPLRYLINDNRFHRVHHSIEPEHWNKNFGVFTPLWDVVFRTAYFPKPGEWPATGTPEAPEPTSLTDWLFRPARAVASGRQGGVEGRDQHPGVLVIDADAETDLVQ